MRHRNFHSSIGPMFGYLAAVIFLTASASQSQSATLYGVSNTGVSNNVTSQLVTIDPTTGAGTVVGEISSGPHLSVTGLAFDSSTDTLFGIRNSQLITIDPATGAATTVGATGISSIRGLSYDPSTETLYAVENRYPLDRLLTIDRENAAVTVVGSFASFRVFGIAFDSDADTLFGVGGSPLELITIDTAAATGTTVGVTGASVTGLAFDSSSNTLFSTNSVFGVGPRLLSIDPTTGAAAVVGPIGILGVSSLVIIPSVPEPSSISMALIGVCALLRRRIRSRYSA